MMAGEARQNCNSENTFPRLHALTMFWRVPHHTPHRSRPLPNDVWLHVLSFCSRTWFVPPRCALCGLEAGSAGVKKLRRCPCTRVYYCGKKHQLEDWKRHKRTCTSAKKKKKTKT